MVEKRKSTNNNNNNKNSSNYEVLAYVHILPAVLLTKNLFFFCLLKMVNMLDFSTEFKINHSFLLLADILLFEIKRLQHQ